MSPSEYSKIASIIKGLRVVSVSCKIVARNPRTAFETNASTSNLATLNQNKFINIAHGIVNNTRGFNLKLNFETSTSTMVPTAAQSPSIAEYLKAISSMYGTVATEADFDKPNWTAGSTLPCSYMNLPVQFPYYYCMYANNKQNSGNLGWPMIHKFIEKQDASNIIGKTVVEYQFKPKAGFITAPWQPVYSGYVDTEPKNTNKFRLYNMGATKTPSN